MEREGAGEGLATQPSAGGLFNATEHGWLRAAHVPVPVPVPSQRTLTQTQTPQRLNRRLQRAWVCRVLLSSGYGPGVMRQCERMRHIH